MRALRRLVITLLVLVVLALVVDRVGAYAASKAADSAAKKQGVGDVNVRILGFPFLTQVAAGKLDHVTVSEKEITADGVTIDSVYATGRGVHLSFSAVVAGRVRSVPIDHVEGSAVITYATFEREVAQAIGFDTGLSLSLGASPDPGHVVAHLTGPAGLSLSQTLPVPTVSDGRLQLGAFVQRLSSYVPSSVARDLSVPLPTLPYGLQLGSATAEADGVHFTVTGSDVTIPTSS